MGQMLPEQMIAMLNSVGPARGADMLLSMPPDQIQVLISLMTPSEVGRLLDGARADDKPGLLAAIGPNRWPMVLGQFATHQIVDLVSSLPLPVAVTIMRSMSRAAAADLLMEFPTQRRAMLQEALFAEPAQEAGSSSYHRQAEESVGRIATRMTRLENGSGDLLAEVMGRPFHIAIRHAGEAGMSGDEVRMAAGRVDWRVAAALLVLTNLAPGDTVPPVIRELRQYGHAIDVVQWSNDADDGAFKRAIVGLIR